MKCPQCGLATAVYSHEHTVEVRTDEQGRPLERLKTISRRDHCYCPHCAYVYRQEG